MKSFVLFVPFVVKYIKSFPCPSVLSVDKPSPPILSTESTDFTEKISRPDYCDSFG